METKAHSVNNNVSESTTNQKKVIVRQYNNLVQLQHSSVTD